MREERQAGNTVLPAPPKTVFHADRSTQEKEHGKRKRSLGSARDDDTRIPLPARFSSRCDANLHPFGAPPSKGRRENTASWIPHEEGLRYENTASPYRHFEHGAVKPPRRIAPSPVSSFRAKARNLFRSRSRKDVRGAGNGKPSAPCAPKKCCFMQAVSCRKMKKKASQTGDKTKKKPRLSAELFHRQYCPRTSMTRSISIGFVR